MCQTAVYFWVSVPPGVNVRERVLGRLKVRHDAAVRSELEPWPGHYSGTLTEGLSPAHCARFAFI